MTNLAALVVSKMQNCLGSDGVEEGRVAWAEEKGGKGEAVSDINEEIEVDDGGANGCEKRRRGWNGNGLN